MNRWTEEEIEELKLGYSIGLSSTEIGNILNRSSKSICQKALRLDLTHPNKCILKTQNQYVNELKNKCPTIIVLDLYIDCYTKILHKCLICGEEHLASPTVKLRGWGHCGRRSNNGGGIVANEPGILYLVYIHTYDLYKIGITGKTIKERFKDNRLSEDKYEIILERHFDSGIECETLEKKWLSNVEEYKVNTGLLKSGNTETFKL